MEVVQEERVFLCLTDAFNPSRAGLELQDYDHVVSEEDDVDALFLAGDWEFEEDVPGCDDRASTDQVAQDRMEASDVCDPGDGLGGALGLKAAAGVLREQAAGELAFGDVQKLSDGRTIKRRHGWRPGYQASGFPSRVESVSKSKVGFMRTW